jgi:hypothetical protein
MWQTLLIQLSIVLLVSTGLKDKFLAKLQFATISNKTHCIAGNLGPI